MRDDKTSLEAFIDRAREDLAEKRKRGKKKGRVGSAQRKTPRCRRKNAHKRNRHFRLRQTRPTKPKSTDKHPRLKKRHFSPRQFGYACWDPECTVDRGVQIEGPPILWHKPAEYVYANFFESQKHMLGYIDHRTGHRTEPKPKEAVSKPCSRKSNSTQNSLA